VHELVIIETGLIDARFKHEVYQLLNIHFNTTFLLRPTFTFTLGFLRNYEISTLSWVIHVYILS